MTPLVERLYVPSVQPEWFYRGVHGRHPALAAARNGMVIPGSLTGTITAQLHNEGFPADLAVSPFTSWTVRRSVAEARASLYSIGVLLRLPAEPVSGPGWQWEGSPDEFLEYEVLLRGIRMDAEVLR